MNSTIIAIGDELVSGFRDETNSKWLAEKLLSIDINVLSVMVVGDNEENIIYALNQALNYKDIDYVFITGGLGPTNDDITLRSLANFLKSDLFFDGAYFEKLKNRSLRIATENRQDFKYAEAFRSYGLRKMFG